MNTIGATSDLATVQYGPGFTMKLQENGALKGNCFALSGHLLEKNGGLMLLLSSRTAAVHGIHFHPSPESDNKGVVTNLTPRGGVIQVDAELEIDMNRIITVTEAPSPITIAKRGLAAMFTRNPAGKLYLPNSGTSRTVLAAFCLQQESSST